MIREATEKDLIDILEIYNDAILTTTAVYTYKPQTLESKQIWYKQKIAEGYPLLVWEQDDKVVGYATFGPLETGLLINIPLNIPFM